MTKSIFEINAIKLLMLVVIIVSPEVRFLAFDGNDNFRVRFEFFRPEVEIAALLIALAVTFIFSLRILKSKIFAAVFFLLVFVLYHWSFLMLFTLIVWEIRGFV